jgi:hypothetical protein
MADTELQALVVKLEADINSFKTDLLRGQKSVEDAAKQMGAAVDKFAEKSEEGFGDLHAMIGTTAKILGAGGALYEALELTKKAMEVVFEGENIRATNQQFEILARNAGVAGEALKEGLVGAANGLVDDTDLIKQANSSLVAMGSVAKDLPKVMDLARQATAAFGGSAAQNFEAMATAIANGNMRALKNLGIVVDEEAAYKKFAEGLNKTAEELSQTGKQQALMNAVLEKGQAAFKGVDDSILKNQTTWTQFKVTMGQVGETATLAFEKIAGPYVQTLLQNLKAMSEDAKRSMTANFGEGAEKAQASVEILRDKLMQLKGTMVDLEQKKLGHVVDFNPGDTASRMQALQIQIKQTEEALSKTEAQLPKTAEAHKQLAGTVDANKDSYIKLKEAQDYFVENGIKIAKELAESGPEAFMKEQLEELQAMREADLISLTDYYDLQKSMLANKYEEEQAMVQAAHDKGKIDEVTYQSAIMGLRGKAASDQKKLADQQTKDEKEHNKQKLAETSATLGSISTLMNTNNRTLFEIGKAAAIANATINMYEGISKAWALGPILGPILAPLVAVAGAAQIAGIASQQPHFAEGGTVPGFGFGDTQQIAAEPGEEIIDRSTSRRFRSFMDRMDGGGGSSPTNINIALELRGGLGQLVEMVEEGIVERQRLGISLLTTVTA